MGIFKRASLVLLLLAGLQTGFAKVFEVDWDVPEDGLILPSVSTAKCGDVVRFKCPPQATHGVYKMTSVNGTCPDSFDILSAGVVLSAPTKGCDFSLVLGDEPDFFVTSQAGSACQKNLKMNIHSVCPQTSGMSASGVLGFGNTQSPVTNTGGSWSTGVVPGSRFAQAGTVQSPLAAAQNAYSSGAYGSAGYGSTAMDQQQQGLPSGSQEAGATKSAAAMSTASLLGLAAVGLAAGITMLL